MRSLPLRRLARGDIAGDRVFYTAFWLREVNNARYDELLPRLDRLDAYLLTASSRRLPRGLQYRAFRSPVGAATLRAIHAAAARRYRGAFCTEFRQLRTLAVPTVVDVDDTDFSPEQAALLNRPHVAAYVVTTERAARRFEALGVEKPWHVIPQGVGLASLPAEEVERVRRDVRREGELAVAYSASLLFTRGDADGEHPLYSIDHLLELWEGIRARVPAARLWLLGKPSARVRQRLAGRDDVLLLGWLPRPQALAHLATADVALYPRQAEFGLQAVKASEYLGLGLPTVSYDLDVVDALRAGGARLVRTPADFVQAVVALAGDSAERARLGAEARELGRALDWDVLARRYERDVLDVYLPR